MKKSKKLKTKGKRRLFPKLIFFLFLLLSISCFASFFIEKEYQIFNPKIISIDLIDYNSDTNKIKVAVDIENKLSLTDVNCSFKNDKDEIIKIDSIDNKCITELDKDDYFISLNRENIKISNDYLLSNIIESTLKLVVNDDKFYLAVGDTYKLNFDIISLRENESLIYETLDKTVASVDSKGVVKGLKDGSTYVVAKDKYNNEAKVEVVVSNLVSKKTINNKKAFLPCNIYSESEAKLLDEILASRIKNAGKNTRAGVVAAARFLSLEFKYKIGYFLENGRLNPRKGRPYADGEGRYYHEGLYLSKDKFSTIEKSVAGPAIWGCKIREYSMKNTVYRANGLDCSGYVTWSLLNGGYDFGDLGSVGWSYDGIKDLSWLGDHVEVTLDLLKSGKVKAGDLAAEPGHVAIVIGIDNEKEMIYIAEEYYHKDGLTVVPLTFEDLAKYKRYTHLTLMDKAYIEDGNYTPMW